jgi:nucleoside-diphosphate-sugar epimerase
MTSDGTPWRPLVHVQDICKAIICSLEAPKEAIHNQKFNVGHDGDNYQVKDIAEIVADVFTGCELTFGPSGGDNRSYRVSFEKISTQLPGFKCDWDARKGTEELYEIYSRIDMPRETFEFRPFTRLKQLKYLIATRQIDEEFYWRY